MEHITISKQNQLITAFEPWVVDYIENRKYEGYLLSFMFHRISGSPDHLQRIMEEGVCRCYARCATRVMRNPHSEHNREWPMVWIAAPDRPVPKGEKKRLWEIKLNGGIHMHAIALVPPFNRLKQPLDEHIMHNQRLYALDPVYRLHAVHIDRTPEKATDYVHKSLKRGSFAYEDLLVLPRTRHELSR